MGEAELSLLNHSLDEGDLSFCNSISSSKPTMRPLGIAGMGGMGSTITPRGEGLAMGLGGGSLYDEAAIEAAAEIAMLMSICTDRKSADQLLKAVLTDNLQQLNAAAMAIISAGHTGRSTLSLPPTRR